MSDFDLQRYKSTFADPATTGERIMHRQWTVDEAYEIVAEVERLRKEAINWSQSVEAIKEYNVNYQRDCDKEIESLTNERDELKKNEDYWRRSYYQKEKQFTASEKKLMERDNA